MPCLSTLKPGADPGFSEGGQNQDWIKRGRAIANHSIISLKQGVWGCSLQEAMGYLILFSTKIPYNAKLDIRLSN